MWIYLQRFDAAHSDHGLASKLSVVSTSNVHRRSVQLFFWQQLKQSQRSMAHCRSKLNLECEVPKRVSTSGQIQKQLKIQNYWSVAKMRNFHENLTKLLRNSSFWVFSFLNDFGEPCRKDSKRKKMWLTTSRNKTGSWKLGFLETLLITLEYNMLPPHSNSIEGLFTLDSWYFFMLRTPQHNTYKQAMIITLFTLRSQLGEYYDVDTFM